MKKILVFLSVFFLLVGSAAMAEETRGKVLIVDQTEGLLESLKLEAMARVLIQQGFAIAAVQGFPQGPVEGAPFDLVLVIPKGGKYLWLCVPPQNKAMANAAGLLTGLKELVGKVFGGARVLRTPAEDLWPLLLSLRLAGLGIFGKG